MRIVHLNPQTESVSGTVAIFGMTIKRLTLLRALISGASRDINHKTEIELYHASLPAEIEATNAAFSSIPNRAFPVLA